MTSTVVAAIFHTGGLPAWGTRSMSISTGPFSVSIVPSESFPGGRLSFGSPSGRSLSLSRSTQSARSRTASSSRASSGPRRARALVGVARRFRYSAARAYCPARQAARKRASAPRGVSGPYSIAGFDGCGAAVVVVVAEACARAASATGNTSAAAAIRMQSLMFGRASESADSGTVAQYAGLPQPFGGCYLERMSIDAAVNQLRQLDEELETLLTSFDTSYAWNYGNVKDGLRDLYEKAKRDQWNGTTQLAWDTDVDPERGIIPDVINPLNGFPPFERLDAKEKNRMRHAQMALQLSQFLHGEQGALIVASQLVGAVPWIDAKYYAGTQTMDEARHVEVFSRYLREKLEWQWPVNESLKELL